MRLPVISAGCFLHGSCNMVPGINKAWKIAARVAVYNVINDMMIHT